MHPRRTVAEMLGRDEHQRGVRTLVFLSALSLLVSLREDLSDLAPVWVLAVVGLPISYLLCSIGLNLMTRLFNWIGEKLGGSGTRERVRLALAWSSLASSAAVGLDMLLLRIAPKDSVYWVLALEGHLASIGLVLLNLGIYCWVWWVIFVSLAEAMRFSVLQAVATVMLPHLALVAVLYVPILFAAFAA